ncbi:hypothetical protein [Cryptosporangium phraense]|uniref:Uncharacterized protein n=1 Tax=Cryptosporangium phraense TaxID=2593070 RepID=A0A545AQY3_9ACTN|nr:hypothetical protein [Cryptosporangium phraense]TQS43739.1 hypothetical protein FL583_17025 [Cryptosporangium phraense]
MPATHVTTGQGDLWTAADLDTVDQPAIRLEAGELHMPPRPRQDADQPGLFDLTPPPEPPSLPYLAADSAPLAEALTGDGYAWLAAVLPEPAPVWCAAHRVPMVLTGAARLVYGCARCDAECLDVEHGGGSAVAA